MCTPWYAMLVSFPLVSFVEKLGNNQKNSSGDNNRLKTQETSQFLTQPLWRISVWTLPPFSVQRVKPLSHVELGIAKALRITVRVRLGLGCRQLAPKTEKKQQLHSKSRDQWSFFFLTRSWWPSLKWLESKTKDQGKLEQSIGSGLALNVDFSRSQPWGVHGISQNKLCEKRSFCGQYTSSVKLVQPKSAAKLIQNQSLLDQQIYVSHRRSDIHLWEFKVPRPRIKYHANDAGNRRCWMRSTLFASWKRIHNPSWTIENLTNNRPGRPKMVSSCKGLLSVHISSEKITARFSVKTNKIFWFIIIAFVVRDCLKKPWAEIRSELSRENNPINFHWILVVY